MNLNTCVKCGQPVRRMGNIGKVKLLCMNMLCRFDGMALVPLLEQRLAAERADGSFTPHVQDLPKTIEELIPIGSYWSRTGSVVKKDNFVVECLVKAGYGNYAQDAVVWTNGSWSRPDDVLNPSLFRRVESTSPNYVELIPVGSQWNHHSYGLSYIRTVSRHVQPGYVSVRGYTYTKAGIEWTGGTWDHYTDVLNPEVYERFVPQ